MAKESKVKSKTKLPIVADGDPVPPPCPKGYIRDPRTGLCVPDIGYAN